jgi:hypothetical protein
MSGDYMVRRNLALILIAASVVLFVSSLYGLFTTTFFFPVVGLSSLTLVLGLILLLWAARPWNLAAPHSWVIGITMAAIGLHVYEHIYKSSGDVSIGFSLWPMLPYALSLTLSSFQAIRKSAIAGAVLALIFDMWGHYAVFINPDSSTASLVLLFIPLWSTIILVPASTFILWLIIRRPIISQKINP